MALANRAGHAEAERNDPSRLRGSCRACIEGPCRRAGYFRSVVLRLAEVDEDLSEPEDVSRLVVALRLVPEDIEAVSLPLSVSSPRPREPVAEEEPLSIWPLLVCPLLVWDLSDIEEPESEDC